MAHSNVYTAIAGQILRETDAAIQVRIEDLETKEVVTEWFPFSQISQVHRTYSLMEGTLDWIMVSEWVLGKKELTNLIGQFIPASLK